MAGCKLGGYERSFEKWSKPQKIELGGSEKEPVKVQIKYSGDKLCA